ncbi:putative secreted protein [Pseudonocardia sp. Ae168_Ps1]|nr:MULTISPECIES: L,D-transpeptidase [unclassified Pseudonocardia]OLL76921.1 putative secreted protein [Pseudonocardia sp. Ae150A_Ps1]OLL82937.1 putative secreted protein [Pseudonocardia sp. Ae168_Ps1]OLL82954.1 putative secreted protein [Pseudonocardia sp. Ae263_Ps1]OLL91008.1 putative secreted protein [Pseudonocardia sp. Ae356_Ps1]
MHVPSRTIRRNRAATAAVAALVVVAGIATAGVATADAEAENSEAARQTHAEKQVPGTPCSVSARACVDLETQRAWLIENGAVTHGPVPVASGGAGQETPIGHSFRVYRKEADHTSGEFTTPEGQPSPMPWSVFFADGGVAFHGGDRDRASAGCVKLDAVEAQRFFTDLDNGDKVQVLNATTERDERAKLATA